MNVDIKRLTGADTDTFKELISLFSAVFEMENFVMPDENHLEELLKNDQFFVFVALYDHQVAGGLTAYTLQQYYSTLPQVYIYDVAVAIIFQRKGIGKQLINAITDYCKEIGTAEVFVQAEEADAHAVAFYHSTGATAQKVIHFNYPLRPVEYK